LAEGGRRPGEGTGQGALTLSSVTLHNLDHIDVKFPLNSLCVVTGVSGSGKSSLIEHTLFPALCQRFGTACDVDPVGEFSALTGAEQIDEAVFLDSSPIRRSARANAATMLHLLAEIRRLFAQTTEAKVKNFTARHFSFNANDGGRCPRCRGLGAVEIDMQFLANLTVVCPECHGTRFQRELLDCKLRGLSIAEVLNLSADEAFTFFRGQPQLQRRLKSLKDVGLGYVPLGQSANTFSRGECQRLKLATLLVNRSRKRTLFLLDEPCIGLHARDIVVLLECFRRLIEVGHSLIAIEHRPEFIAAADWIIELGPGAGDAGGRIMRLSSSPLP
jgi:excinuclease ABC subunit A